LAKEAKMAYGIGLTLDKKLEGQVRQLWRQFEAAGVGKTPGQFDEPPHITFSVFPSGDPAPLVELVEATLVADSRVKLIPFGAFLEDKHVLYYSAVLSQGLQQAHARHFEIIRARNIEHNLTYMPGNVLFHCTMAVDIEPGDFPKGIDICFKNREVLEGTVTQMELFEFFPVKPIHRKRIIPAEK
jgi:2'-5' RNA ligase